MASPSEFLQFTVSFYSAIKCQFIFGHIFSCITFSSTETSQRFSVLNVQKDSSGFCTVTVFSVASPA